MHLSVAFLFPRLSGKPRICHKNTSIELLNTKYGTNNCVSLQDRIFLSAIFEGVTFLHISFNAVTHCTMRKFLMQVEELVQGWGGTKDKFVSLNMLQSPEKELSSVSRALHTLQKRQHALLMIELEVIFATDRHTESFTPLKPM